MAGGPHRVLPYRRVTWICQWDLFSALCFPRCGLPYV